MQIFLVTKKYGLSLPVSIRASISYTLFTVCWKLNNVKLTSCRFFSQFTGLLGVKKLLLGKKNECAFSAARLMKVILHAVSINEFGSSETQFKAIVRISFNKGKICNSCKLLMVFPHIYVYFASQHLVQWPNSDPSCISSVLIQIYWVRYQLTVKCTEAFLISLKSQAWDSTEKLLLFSLRLVFFYLSGMLMLHPVGIYENLLFQYSDLKIKRCDCSNL